MNQKLNLSRRAFLLSSTVLAGTTCLPEILLSAESQERHQMPNIILCMCDDLGWGDVGYNGNEVAETPNLDQMANEGVCFDRFYSASAVCSPTRASCLTGRNPYRTGVFYANMGILRPEEFTLMKYLKEKGYATGHFGKWHLGTLTNKEKDSRRAQPDNNVEFNPPWLHGFDQCFSTEAKVPTYDPMKMPETFLNKTEQGKWFGWQALKEGEKWKPFGTAYWNEKGEKIKDNLEGDDSEVIMNRVIPFIEKQAQNNTPFLAVIWFHTPHLPCVCSPKKYDHYRKKGLSDQQSRYYGCVTAMDEQMGRLRAALNKNNIEDNTMLWFTSDNGPETESGGTAGKFRGEKRDLYEGGVRVPGILNWPGKIKDPFRANTPCVTSDYLPTIMAL